MPLNVPMQNKEFCKLNTGKLFGLLWGIGCMEPSDCNVKGFVSQLLDENCSLLYYYAASSGNCLPNFRDNISVPFSGPKNPKITHSYYLVSAILSLLYIFTVDGCTQCPHVCQLHGISNNILKSLLL
jgi:hypothetical protein